MSSSQWRGAGLQVLVQPREWNFAEVDAIETLDQVERGEAPVEAMAWVSVMQRGNEPATIDRWLKRARRETNPQRRADLGLVQVFAELTNSQDEWSKALKGWKMQDSQIVKGWEDKAFAKGEIKGRTEGKTEGKVESLLQVLEKRFKTVPDELRTAILAIQDADRLTAWVDIALTVRSLRAFRKQAEV